MCVSRGVSLVIAMLLWSGVSSAQVVEPVAMLKDINVAENVAQSLTPESMTVVAGVTYFSGTTAAQGTELWAYDGVVAPYLVADINPWGDSNPQVLTAFNGELYFLAESPAYGRELWRSNGTASGTVLVKDIFPGERDGIGPNSLVEVAGQLYFVGNDPVAGSQLWVSDGTESGTVQYATLRPNPSGLYPPSNLFSFGNQLAFSGNDGTGYELWLAGSANEGPVGDFLSASVLPPKSYVDINGVLYFIANQGAGDELWVYDDTASPKVRNITAMALSNVHNLIQFQNELYFLADDGGGDALWRYDPAALPVPQTTNIVPVSPAAVKLLGLGVIAGELNFYALDALGNTGLWLTDSTGLTARKLADLGNLEDEPLPDLGELNGLIYFANHGAGVDSELYVSDGTEANVSLFNNLNVAGSSGPSGFISFDGGLLFSAEDYINGRELWWTDGVIVTQVSDTRAAAESAPYGFGSFGDADEQTLYFSAGDTAKGVELWTSAATSVSTKNAVNANISGSSFPSYLAAFDTDYAFIAEGEVGYELWVNKRGDIHKVIDVVNDDKSAIEMVTVGKRVYFVGYDEDFGYELWRSNGALDRTSVLKDINLAGDSNPQNLLATPDVANVSLYFSADDGRNGRELWMSDGTAGGTVLVVDINPTGSAEPYGMTVMGGYVYYVADDGRYGTELWRSRLGRQDAELVADIRLLGHAYPKQLTVMGDELFFVADNGYFGRELWKTDGTEEGTVLVKDINAGGHGTEMNNFVVVDDLLYFSAGTANGVELWVSDGTAAGTMLLADINPSGSSDPSGFVALGGYVYFSAFHEDSGRELWRTDGTTAGTILVKDIHPIGSSEPEGLHVLRDKLYFSATDGVHGRELWMLDGGGIHVDTRAYGGGVGSVNLNGLMILMLIAFWRYRRLVAS